MIWAASTPGGELRRPLGTGFFPQTTVLTVCRGSHGVGRSAHDDHGHDDAETLPGSRFACLYFTIPGDTYLQKLLVGVLAERGITFWCPKPPGASKVLWVPPGCAWVPFASWVPPGCLWVPLGASGCLCLLPLPGPMSAPSVQVAFA